MKKPRNLSPEERELWSKVARQTERLRTDTFPAALQDDQSDHPASPRTPSKASGPSFAPLKPSSSKGAVVSPRQLVQMDQKSFGRMVRGKLKPEARIDLHGMTLAQAHPEMIAFILRAHQAGKRLVLVITGKGARTESSGIYPSTRGVLRRQVPEWLRLAPLSSVVLQVSTAHQRHGGDGAFYVYLRRSG